ncbi:hypothetical protein LTR37_011034 [Vermiconidia calcicola]|uniref:Uncharacterized protein n=1 Tax=Vermiconidia calcicola TaxID=1690605 RepID=A0ACC3N3R8_9PEZI|nr:hypothetical protein LTR37_011034 [Vermiconidia calcicola]
MAHELGENFVLIKEKVMQLDSTTNLPAQIAINMLSSSAKICLTTTELNTTSKQHPMPLATTLLNLRM